MFRSKWKANLFLAAAVSICGCDPAAQDNLLGTPDGLANAPDGVVLPQADISAILKGLDVPENANAVLSISLRPAEGKTSTTAAQVTLGEGETGEPSGVEITSGFMVLEKIKLKQEGECDDDDSDDDDEEEDSDDGDDDDEDSDADQDDDPCDDGDPCTVDTTDDTGACAHAENDDDTDEDGMADCDDNCTDVPNGPALGTCVDQPGVTCTSDEDCLVGEDVIPGACDLQQADSDDDGMGDACDEDADGDEEEDGENSDSDGDEDDDPCDDGDPCTVDTTDDNGDCVHAENDDDTDEDGMADCDDNCADVPNGPALGTCVDQPDVTCTSDEDCLVGEDVIPGACDLQQADADDDGMGDACDEDADDDEEEDSDDGDDSDVDEDDDPCDDGDPCTVDTTDDNGECAHAENDDDTDEDGMADCDDNCTDVPNGPALGTCVDQPDVTCTSDEDCLVGEDVIPGACDLQQADSDDDGMGDACDEDNDGNDDDDSSDDDGDDSGDDEDEDCQEGAGNVRLDGPYLVDLLEASVDDLGLGMGADGDFDAGQTLPAEEDSGLLDDGTDAPPYIFDVLALPPGVYRKVEIEIGKLQGDQWGLEDHPLNDQSIVIHGTIDGTEFEYSSGKGVKIKIESDQGILVEDGYFATFLISLNVEAWFADLDLTDAEVDESGGVVHIDENTNEDLYRQVCDAIGSSTQFGHDNRNGSDEDDAESDSDDESDDESDDGNDDGDNDDDTDSEDVVANTEADAA